MDGTATGIIGNLPDFKRWTTVIPASGSHPHWQYLMPSPKLRYFLSKIFEHADSKGQDDCFSVPLQEFPQTVNGLLLKEILGDEDLSEADFNLDGIETTTATSAETVNASQSIRRRKRKPDDRIIADDLRTVDTKCVRNMLRTLLSLDSAGEDGDSVSLVNVLEDVQLRRLVMEFCRCFLTDSIAGGVLWTKSSVDSVRLLSEKLFNFSNCAQNDLGQVRRVMCVGIALKS